MNFLFLCFKCLINKYKKYIKKYISKNKVIVIKIVVNSILKGNIKIHFNNFLGFLKMSQVSFIVSRIFSGIIKSLINSHLLYNKLMVTIEDTFKQ
jgi:hypothetical protein